MKSLISLLITSLLLLSLAFPAFAAGGSPKIVDQADLLLPSEEATLETMSLYLAEEYSIDAVILTVDSTHGKDITEYADDYFDNNGYGIGADHSGVLLILSMDEREWAISTCGNAIHALSDYGQEQIMDVVVKYFSNGDYYEGFSAFLEFLDDYFAAFEKGEPIEKPRTAFDMVFDVFIALSIGAAAGGITIWIMRAGMKTVKPQSGAVNYIQEGSYHLRNQRDIYLYSRTSRTRKQSSSGGSSTHRSSSGRSHGGSSGRF